MFTSGLGIDISETHIRLARVSFFGRVLETKELPLPTGLVVDDQVADPKGFQEYLKKSLSSHEGRHVPAVLTIPDSRQFEAELKTGDDVGSTLQKQVPLPIRETVVTQDVRAKKAYLVEKTVLQSFVEGVQNVGVDVHAIESRFTAIERFMLYFKNKKQPSSDFQVAVGVALRAVHPWRHRQESNFLFPMDMSHQKGSARRSLGEGGFTLVELLVVLAIIAILVTVVFVALNPAERFAQARDAVRQNDVGEILSSIKLYQVDNGGDHLASIAALTAGSVYMAVNGATMTTGCDDNNLSCETIVTNDTACVNLAGLVTGGYLPSMPVSPAGVITWDDGSGATDEGSGYTISADANGIVTVRACESEYAGNPEIEAAR